MKYLILAALFYFSYRLYIKPFLIDGDPADRKRKLREQEKQRNNDGEFIDYEEVD